MISKTKYHVTYRNQGKKEQADYNTREEAKEGAEFLRFQGAKCIRVVEDQDESNRSKRRRINIERV